MKYNWDLMMAIMHDRLSVAKLLNIQIISLEEVPRAFQQFDKGLPVKYIVDPHNCLRSKETYQKKQMEMETPPQTTQTTQTTQT